MIFGERLDLCDTRVNYISTFAWRISWSLIGTFLVFSSTGCNRGHREDVPLLVLKIQSGNPVNNTEFSEAGLDYFQFFLEVSYPELTEIDRKDPEIMSFVFDRFVEDLSLAGCAREHGAIVTQEAVDQFIQLELTHMTFVLQSTEHQALYRKEIRKRLLIKGFLKSEMLDQVEITTELAHEYYNQNVDAYMIEPKFCIRQIKFESKEVAIKFRKAFNQGQKTFMELSESFAEDASAFELAPCLPLGSFPESFRKTIRRLRPGAISGVLPLDYGGKTLYHVLMLERKTPSVEYSFEEMRPKIQSGLEKDAIDKKLKQKKMEYNATRKIQIFKENLPFEYIEPEKRRSEQ